MRPTEARHLHSHVLVVALLVGCAPEETMPPEPPETEDPCADVASPGCRTAGVPEGACGAGFESDGQGGCMAILPEAPCGPGEIAVPGDSACRPIGDCGEGTWGLIPDEPATQHVNGAYANSDSDGSAAKPWRTVQAGIDAAAPGAIVAVAAGSYAEDVQVANRRVRLWGRCPALVTLDGTGGQPAGVFVVQGGASGTAVRGLAVTGPAGGIGVSGATDVRLEELWLHDLGDRGLYLPADLGGGAVEIRNVLVERAAHVGIQVQGYQALIEGTVVRETAPTPGSLDSGRGISVSDHLASGLRSAVTVTGSLVEKNHTLGIYFGGSDGVVEATLVRDTQPRVSDGLAGRGIGIEDNLESGEVAKVAVARSVLARNHDIGLFVGGAEATLEGVTIVDTFPRAATGTFGGGLAIERALDTGQPSTVFVRQSLLANNHNVGILVYESSATVTEVAVRSTQPQPDGLFGDGISVVAVSEPASGVLTDVEVGDNARAGIGAFGAVVTLQGAALHCNAFDLTGEATAAGNYQFQDAGDNDCGCQEAATCKVVSATLTPPGPAGG